jgi:proteasome lid subunit RPN8/RPN11
MRFSPTAWAKLLFLRDRGSTEVGGFGITPAEDLLYVEDLQLIQQTCTAVSVAFDDTAVAEFFEEQVDAGRRPEQFARIWIHTHPGDSAEPSQVDEETFERVFGACDWAVMFIIAREGETYSRLRFRAGPGGGFEISTKLDYENEFGASDQRAWAEEYANSVKPFPALATEDPIRDLFAEEISFGDYPTFFERAEFFGEELLPDERAF